MNFAKNGGGKHFWLKNNKDLVIKFYNEFGLEATLKQFDLRPPTLERLMAVETHAYPEKLSLTDHAELIAGIAGAKADEARQKIKELEDKFALFQETIINGLAEKAKVNLSLGGGDKKSEEFKSGLQNSAKAVSNTIDTREELAQIAHVSHDTIAKVKTIDADAPDFILSQANSGELSVNQATTRPARPSPIRTKKRYYCGG